MIKKYEEDDFIDLDFLKYSFFYDLKKLTRLLNMKIIFKKLKIICIFCLRVFHNLFYLTFLKKKMDFIFGKNSMLKKALIISNCNFFFKKNGAVLNSCFFYIFIVDMSVHDIEYFFKFN